MNNLPLITIGILLTVMASLAGLVLIPDWQLDQMKALEMAGADGNPVVYPAPLDAALEAPGKQVYQSLGCIYCHSQQVRPEGFGADLERGWGMRRSVPRDYVLQDPPLLGTMRTGPDLANIGFRQPDDDWHYLHLYYPPNTSPGSVMPPFRFLFDTYVDQAPVLDEGESAIELPESYSDRPTWIVPRPRARQLVAYLKTLNQLYTLEEVR